MFHEKDGSPLIELMAEFILQSNYQDSHHFYQLLLPAERYQTETNSELPISQESSVSLSCQIVVLF